MTIVSRSRWWSKVFRLINIQHIRIINLCSVISLRLDPQEHSCRSFLTLKARKSENASHRADVGVNCFGLYCNFISTNKRKNFLKSNGILSNEYAVWRRFVPTNVYKGRPDFIEHREFVKFSVSKNWQPSISSCYCKSWRYILLVWIRDFCIALGHQRISRPTVICCCYNVK